MQQRPATSVHWTAWTRLHNEVQVLALIRNTRLAADISPSKPWLHFNPLSHTKEKQRAGGQKSLWKRLCRGLKYFCLLGGGGEYRSVTKLQEVYCEVSEHVKASQPCAQPGFNFRKGITVYIQYVFITTIKIYIQKSSTEWKGVQAAHVNIAVR